MQIKINLPARGYVKQAKLPDVMLLSKWTVAKHRKQYGAKTLLLLAPAALKIVLLFCSLLGVAIEETGPGLRFQQVQRLPRDNWICYSVGHSAFFCKVEIMTLKPRFITSLPSSNVDSIFLIVNPGFLDCTNSCFSVSACEWVLANVVISIGLKIGNSGQTHFLTLYPSTFFP